MIYRTMKSWIVVSIESMILPKDGSDHGTTLSSIDPVFTKPGQYIAPGFRLAGE